MVTVAQSIRVALFFLFGVALTWIVYETFTESNLYSDLGYDIKAPFSDIRQLKSGSDIRMSGVSVGAVRKMELKNGQALVTISIENEYAVPADSVASITTAGLLGNNYISISAGKAKVYLKQGDTIKTQDTPNISDVIVKLGGIGDRLNGFMDDMQGDGKGLGELFNGFHEMIEVNQAKIEKSLANLEVITSRLVEGKGTLGKLINEDEIYQNMIAASTEIRDAAKSTAIFMDTAETVVTNIKSGKGTLGTLLHDDQIAIDIKKSVSNIHDFSEKLNSHESSLGRLMQSDELYTQAEDILQKVDNAVNNVENSGPITAVGVVAGALF